MAEIVTYISNIRPGYDNYVVALLGGYGNTAEKVLSELFEQVAIDLGPKNVIVKPRQRAIEEIEDLYGITAGDRRPVLILTDTNPQELRKRRLQGDGNQSKVEIIKIELGAIEDAEDRVRHLLGTLVTMIRSDDYRGANWERRKLEIQSLFRKVKSIGTVVSLARAGTGLI